MGLGGFIKKVGRGAGKIAMAPVSGAAAGIAAAGGGLAGLATGDTEKAKEWAKKAGGATWKGSQWVGGKLGEAGATGGVSTQVDIAKKVAAKGAEEAAAKQASQQPAGGTTGTPKTELSPINIQKPEMIGSLAGSELLSEEQKAVLAARQKALEGMTPEELAMRRSQMGLAQGATEQARQRQLASALARSGVRGGAAGAAQSRAAQLAAQERAAQAQELQLADEQRRREALTEMEKTVGGLTGEAGKRQFMGLAADIAGSQLGVARETGQLGAEAIGKYGELMAGQPQQRGALQNFFGGLF